MRHATPVCLLLLVVLAVPAGAEMPLFQTYVNLPGEHDDLGSSNEPDFPGVTNVLGHPLPEFAVDRDLNGIGDPYFSIPQASRGLAPGCTDDTGRQANGRCGLWTIGAQNGDGTRTGRGVPPNLAGVQGMSGSAAPGLTLTKNAAVRFLDQKVAAFAMPPGLGPYAMDYNKKLSDSGLRASLLSAVGPDGGSDFLLGAVLHYAWYGRWQDKNGNGIIDHLQAGEAPDGSPVEDPANEFVWYGNCRAFDGSTSAGWHCVDESRVIGQRVTIDNYVVPGNHHAFCGAYVLGAMPQACFYVGADLPGAMALCLANVAVSPAAPLVTVLTGRCGGVIDAGTLAAFEASVEGDPVFGSRGLPTPDGPFDDRTGDPSWNTRMWTFGLGWPAYYYDQSVVTTTVTVAAANCGLVVRGDRPPPVRHGLDPQPAAHTCPFVDVDVYATWSPQLQALLDQQVRPVAAGGWVLLRDLATAGASGASRHVFAATLDARPWSGPLDDLLVDPGWPREPNDERDAYPGAARAACPDPEATFKGWCNRYAAGPQLWGDNRMFRALTYERAVSITGVPGCVMCAAAPGMTTTASPEPMGMTLRATGDHRRSLGPGFHFAAGFLGQWDDLPQVWTEAYTELDPLSPAFGATVSRTHAAEPDGWVGNIVNTTGTFRYRGYTDQECATDKGPGLKPYAACHPYLHGALQDPQAPGTTTHGEWRPACDDSPAAGLRLEVRPQAPAWTVPVFVLEYHESLELPGEVRKLRDHTGRSEPIVLDLACRILQTGEYQSTGILLLPMGNLGLPVETELRFRDPSTGAALLDVDRYDAWGP